MASDAGAHVLLFVAAAAGKHVGDPFVRSIGDKLAKPLMLDRVKGEVAHKRPRGLAKLVPDTGKRRKRVRPQVKRVDVDWEALEPLRQSWAAYASLFWSSTLPPGTTPAAAPPLIAAAAHTLDLHGAPVRGQARDCVCVLCVLSVCACLLSVWACLLAVGGCICVCERMCICFVCVCVVIIVSCTASLLRQRDFKDWSCFVNATVGCTLLALVVLPPSPFPLHPSPQWSPALTPASLAPMACSCWRHSTPSMSSPPSAREKVCVGGCLLCICVWVPLCVL